MYPRTTSFFGTGKVVHQQVWCEECVTPSREGIIFGLPARMSHVPTGHSTVTKRPASRCIPSALIACVLLLVLWGMGTQAHGQSGSNLRQRWVFPVNDTISLDTLSIVPGSLMFFEDSIAVDTDRYTLDPYNARVVWPNAPDSVLARYRVMPLLLGGFKQHKDTERLYTPSGDREDPFRYTPPSQQNDLMDMRGLSRSGSISRGVLFGNNQDLSVNSSLNLELSGNISERIGVHASITDNNIPIQAGGNTLELQDFDQVFIKVFEEEETGPGNRWELIAGDFVLQRPKSHFLTYLKKNKGLSFGTKLGSNPVRSYAAASVSISKGKFARNVIQGVEGVQGPYRLRGSAGELFIVVLSGTERVYIDGKPVVRGQENDYIIDYNTAEITFTARRLITKDRRISVEFQYSDKNYARSMVHVENTTEFGNSTVRLNVFSEQDHRNQPLQQQLSEEEREVLRDAGDNPLAATVSGVDSTGFANDQVLYRRTDSLGYSPVYVFSNIPEEAVFRITFTQIGQGNGDYVQQEFTPNGRVFRWVPPDTVNGLIVRRGDHAPVRVLIAPRSQQVITLAVDQRISRYTKAGVEIAYSNNDLNTFSPEDSGDDQGFGFLAQGDHAIPISEQDSTLQIVVGAAVESTSRDFQFVERYRAVEFERNWNAIGLLLDGDQVLSTGFLGLRGRRMGQVNYSVNSFQVKDRYSGWRQDLTSDLRIGRTELIGTGAWLRSTRPRNSDFLRHKAAAKHRLKHFSIGYLDEHERNLFRSDTSDALLAGSYQFYDWEAYMQSPDTFKNKWRVSGGQRYEKAQRDGGLARSTLATAYSLALELARNPRNRLSTAFTYRQLTIIDSLLTPQKPEDTYLARMEYNATLWKGAAVFSTFYEIGSGLEQRREYIYIEVPAGQGLYIWIDYNGNGIRELNEFELANFGYEANFLRVFVPGTDFVRAFSNQFSSSLDLRPSVRWADADGLKRVLAKFSDLASLRVDRKTGTGDLVSALNPFVGETADSALTSYQSSARNTFYYDRTSRTWSIDHTWQNDRNRILLLNGFESRSRLFNTVRVRWNTTQQWTAEMEGEQGRVGNASDLLEGRTFSIDQQALRPRITWQPNTTLRAVLAYKYTEKNNRAEFGGEKALIQDLGAEFRYNTAGKGSILFTANLVQITYDGIVNSSLGNEMLSGLKPGTNGTWSVTLQRNLSNNLQVDITYNGRSSEGVPMVHVGGAQVRAFF